MTPKDLEKWKILKQKISEIEEEIIYPKIDVVVHMILKAFDHNTNVYNWYFPGADDEEVGSMQMNGGHLRVIIDCPYRLDTSSCDYNSCFPVNFLFMDIENIVSYIKAERNKDAAAELNQAKIISQAKQKLYNTFSEEEIRALGLKL